MPAKKIGFNTFIFRLSFAFYQSLQKNKTLFVLLDSENKQTILNEAFNEIGTCNKAINIRIRAINDGLVCDEFFFLEVNLFRGV